MPSRRACFLFLLATLSIGIFLTSLFPRSNAPRSEVSRSNVLISIPPSKNTFGSSPKFAIHFPKTKITKLSNFTFEQLQLQTPPSSEPSLANGDSQTRFHIGDSSSEAASQPPTLEKGKKKPDILWMTEATDLTAEELTPFVANGAPTELIYQGPTGLVRVQNPFPADFNTKSSLFISTEDFVHKIKSSRELSVARADAFRPDPAVGSEWSPMGKKDFVIQNFSRGWKDNRKERIVVNKSISAALDGPDFNGSGGDPNDIESLQKLREKILSFGHSGEITLEISDHGILFDREGADFVIYENPFRIGRGKLYQEFARVGVAEVNEADQFSWFPCEPPTNLVGCAGVVPTNEGGDQFDLRSLEIEQVRFIKIQDIGTNHNMGVDTEGFDLDSVDLLHAFKKGVTQ